MKADEFYGGSMKLLLFAGLFLQVLALQAQTPPPPSGTDLTLDHAIAFISDTFTKQSTISDGVHSYRMHVSREGRCTLRLESENSQYNNAPEHFVYYVRLDRSDAAETQAMSVTNTSFPVVGTHQLHSDGDTTKDFPPNAILGYFFDMKTANAVANTYRNAITLCHVSPDGAQNQQANSAGGSPFNNAIPQPPPPPPASGPTMDQTIAFINKMFLEQGDVEFDDQAASRIEHGQRVELQGQCTLLLSGERIPQKGPPSKYQVKFALNEIDPRTIYVGNAGDIPPRSAVSIRDPANPPYMDKALGFLISKDRAEHMAKAYIHAIALCHKPEEPSLF